MNHYLSVNERCVRKTVNYLIPVMSSYDEDDHYQLSRHSFHFSFLSLSLGVVLTDVQRTGPLDVCPLISCLYHEVVSVNLIL